MLAVPRKFQFIKRQTRSHNGNTSDNERGNDIYGVMNPSCDTGRAYDQGKIDPIAEYSEFILREGTYKEQGQLIEGIKTTFVISNKQIKPLPKGKLSPV
jgi:hypothetical protein